MNTYEQIEAYLQGEMTEGERLQFEEQMQAEPELKADFEVYSAANSYLQNDSIITAGEADLRKTLAETISEQKASKTGTAKLVPVKRGWLYATTAAAAAVALFMLLRPILFNQAIDPQNLYSQYAITDSLAVTTRGNSVETDSILRIVSTNFNSKNYTAAIPALDFYLLKNNGDTKYRMARAFALMETGKYNEAKADLLHPSIAASAYNDEATWYRALLLLKQEDVKGCSDILKTIPRDAATYSKAQQLLSDIGG